MSIYNDSYRAVRDGIIGGTIMTIVSSPVVYYLADLSVRGIYDEYCKTGAPPDVQTDRMAKTKFRSIVGTVAVGLLSSAVITGISAVSRVAMTVLLNAYKL